MNNRFLCNYFAKLSLSVILLTGLFAQAKADTQYGPLRSGETLSSIVNQNYLTSPYDDSVIMREVLRMNPQAFISNNMSLMRRGAMLTLPSDATVRRSQQGNSTRVIQSVPTASSASTRTLEATLSQVRGERDQANLRIRRIKSESETQIEALNSRVRRLESEKRTASEQLASYPTELAELKQSIESLKQENSQLVAKTSQTAVVAATDDKTSKQLEESKDLIVEKQQQITVLESSVSTLNKEAENLKTSHQTAINDLQVSNQALEEKLNLQNQDGSSLSEATKQAEAKIAALNLQHKQQLDELQVSFDAKSLAQDDTGVLKQQHELEIASLNTEHQQVLEDLKAGNQSKESQIVKLTSENKSLTEALSVANVSLETLSMEGASAQQQITTDSGTVDPVQTVDPDPLISGPLTQQLLTQELKKPVAFPLWGLLLGAFSLGFTSLMMLFTRSRKKMAPVAVSIATTPDLHAAEDGRIEPLISYKGDPSAQDPDVETLRVPPRRDPSRVAIMDPTMAATAAVAATAVTSQAAAQVSSQDESEPITPLANNPDVSDSQQFDSKLKLLIAETYKEMGDKSAAIELLSEVGEEGNQEQITEATALIARLNH